jgi:hypothetical protein
VGKYLNSWAVAKRLVGDDTDIGGLFTVGDFFESIIRWIKYNEMFQLNEPISLLQFITATVITK